MAGIAVIPIRTYQASSGTYIDPYAASRPRKWQIAVNLPVENAHFTRKSTVSGTVTYISGTPDSTVFGLTFSSNNEAAAVYNASNYAIKQNIKMIVQLSKIDRSNIVNTYIKSAVRLSGPTVLFYFLTPDNYSAFSTDSIGTIVLPNLASNWSFDIGIQPVRLKKELITYGRANIGDFYNQEIYIHKNDFTSTEISMYQDLDLSNTYIPPGSTMRIGCSYNISCIEDDGTEIAVPGELRFKWEAEGDAQYTASLDTSHFGNTFTVFNSARMNPPFVQQSGRISLSFLNNSGAASTGHIKFYLDEIWIEHNAGDSDNRGYVEIDNYPTRSSLSYTNIDDVEMSRLASGDYYLYSDYGDANESSKWIIESEWVNVILETFNKFKYLESLCKSGSLINLHPALPEMPECITGKIVVKDMRKPNFDFTKSSFKVLFYEV